MPALAEDAQITIVTNDGERRYLDRRPREVQSVK
jgi:hypothetical protein